LASEHHIGLAQNPLDTFPRNIPVDDPGNWCNGFWPCRLVPPWLSACEGQLRTKTEDIHTVATCWSYERRSITVARVITPFLYALSTVITRMIVAYFNRTWRQTQRKSTCICDQFENLDP